MKRVVIGAVLLVGVFALVIGGFFYISGSTAEIIGKAELVQKSFEEGDYGNAVLLAGEAVELWEHFSSNRLLWAENEYIMEIGMLISRVNVLTKMKNDDLLIECAALIAILKDLHDMQAPNYKNIF